MADESDKQGSDIPSILQTLIETAIGGSHITSPPNREINAYRTPQEETPHALQEEQALQAVIDELKPPPAVTPLKDIVDTIRASSSTLSSLTPKAPITAHQNTEDRPVLVIDVGHGEHEGKLLDPGAIALDGATTEREVIEAFAHKLIPTARRAGYDVHVTNSFNPDDPIERSFQDRIDLAHHYANQGRTVLFMSLHADSSAEYLFEGPRVHYHSQAPSSSFSDSMASYLRFAIDGQGDKTNIGRYSVLEPKQIESDISAKRNITNGLGDIPAVLVEIGNLQHPEDFTKLTDNSGAYQWELADKLVLGTNLFYDTRQVGNKNLPERQPVMDEETMQSVQIHTNNTGLEADYDPPENGHNYVPDTTPDMSPITRNSSPSKER